MYHKTYAETLTVGENGADEFNSIVSLAYIIRIFLKRISWAMIAYELSLRSFNDSLACFTTYPEDKLYEDLEEDPIFSTKSVKYL